MATEESILFDYHQALAQAAALDEIASSLERTSRGELEAGLWAAALSWQGDNASRFRNKGAMLQGQLSDTARALHTAASEVLKVAARTRQMELANLALLQK